jgi:hypothetical protein
MLGNLGTNILLRLMPSITLGRKKPLASWKKTKVDGLAVAGIALWAMGTRDDDQ